MNVKMSEDEITSISYGDAIKLIEKHYEEIPHYAIYYSMKQWGSPKVYKSTAKVVRMCVAIDDLGLPITSRMVSDLLDKNTNSLLTTLHNLGDQGILLLTSQTIGNALVWIVNPKFKELIHK